MNQDRKRATRRRYLAVVCALAFGLLFALCAAATAMAGTGESTALPTLALGDPLLDQVGYWCLTGESAGGNDPSSGETGEDAATTHWVLALCENTAEVQEKVLAQFSPEDRVIFVSCEISYNQLCSLQEYLGNSYGVNAQIAAADTLELWLSSTDTRDPDAVLKEIAADASLPAALKLQLHHGVMETPPSKEGEPNETIDQKGEQGEPESPPGAYEAPEHAGEAAEDHYGSDRHDALEGDAAVLPDTEDAISSGSEGRGGRGMIWILLLFLVAVFGAAMLVRIRNARVAMQTDAGTVILSLNESERGVKRKGGRPLSRHTVKRLLRENTPTPSDGVWEQIKRELDQVK